MNNATSLPGYFDNGMRRSDLAWNDWEAISRFLADQVVCRIAIHDDPFPYVLAQSYRFIDGVFLLHCSRFGRMAGLIRRNPHVTIEIDHLVALLKAPKGQNTSFEYYSVLARCCVDLSEDLEAVRRQQYEVLEKYRPERDYAPIDDFAPAQIMTFRCNVMQMSAKKRILADGQYSPPGQPQAPYLRYPFPPPAALSSLPPGAFDPNRFKA
ncbi:pyridoxamine 5'-phosphate oxidase family protein [Azospirillum sp. INR13]|uniref:pyridoxamine 5'-phosphate oxidase family protein n=1 Tax=Azospirillum sp. INR13 TaxID=2596919 RepID=UPI0019D5C8BF|nr:pyridoxamine 5'-phosphate oxidase family protein [Azospirillum sp. INR13]